jgi:hypothetical protein
MNVFYFTTCARAIQHDAEIKGNSLNLLSVVRLVFARCGVVSWLLLAALCVTEGMAQSTSDPAVATDPK